MTQDEETPKRLIGSRMHIGRYEVLSKCEKCGATIWLDRKPENKCQICTVCAIMEIDVIQATNPSVINEMVIDGLKTMQKGGL